MNKRGLGFGGVLLVALLALLAGGLAGGVVAKETAPTKVVREPVSQSSSSPAVSVPTSGPPLSWAQVAASAGRAVVTIINQQQAQSDIFGNPIPGPKAEGSGFIIDRKGDIVTNNHVISQASSLTVVFSDGRKTSAQLVRSDPLTDLAVVKVNVPVPAVLTFGDSSKLIPGDPVLAIGSALGEYRNTVTAGVISALNRTIQEPNQVTLHGMIQTDAAINEGNSGGPLLNDHGQVVGINTAITRGTQQSDLFGLSQSVVAEGLGFAIASNTAKNVAARLLQNKPPAFLGVDYHDVSTQDAQFYSIPVGAYVIDVKSGTPAADAGLKARDIITKVDGTSITDTTTLETIISEHAPGDTIKLTVWRNGQTLTVTVKLGAKPS